MPPLLLSTDRLTLRGPVADDFAAYRSFYADAEASAFYGGPLAPALAWRKLAFDIGHWSLRGFGMWSLVARETGLMIGSCGIVHPEGWPRHELTWWIMPQARRRGYALEASQAVLGWAGQALGWPAVETHMNDENLPARRLAERLDRQVIARELFPDGQFRDVFAMPTDRPRRQQSRHD